MAKVPLNEVQAALFLELFRARNEIAARIDVAVRAAGLDPKTVVGGEVDGPEPHLMVEEPQ